MFITSPLEFSLANRERAKWELVVNLGRKSPLSIYWRSCDLERFDHVVRDERGSKLREIGTWFLHTRCADDFYSKTSSCQRTRN